MGTVLARAYGLTVPDYGGSLKRVGVCRIAQKSVNLGYILQEDPNRLPICLDERHLYRQPLTFIIITIESRISRQGNLATHQLQKTQSGRT